MKEILVDLIQWANKLGYPLNDLCKEYRNCKVAYVEEDGIWVADPMDGHWLSEDEIVFFVSWVNNVYRKI